MGGSLVGTGVLYGVWTVLLLGYSAGCEGRAKTRGYAKVGVGGAAKPAEEEADSLYATGEV